MRLKLQNTIVLTLLIFAFSVSFAETIGHKRTVTTTDAANWNTDAEWEWFDGSSWIPQFSTNWSHLTLAGVVTFTKTDESFSLNINPTLACGLHSKTKNGCTLEKNNSLSRQLSTSGDLFVNSGAFQVGSQVISEKDINNIITSVTKAVGCAQLQINAQMFINGALNFDSGTIANVISNSNVNI